MYISTAECLYQESKKAEVHGDILSPYMGVPADKHLTHQVISSLLTAVVVLKEKQLEEENVAVPPKYPLHVSVTDAAVEPEEREPNVVGLVVVLRVRQHLFHPLLFFQVVPPSHLPPQPVCCPAVYNQHRNMRSIIVITLLV